MSIPSIGPGVSGYTQRGLLNAGFETVYKDQQAQYATAFTTGGTAPNFTITPTPALTAYAAGQEFEVAFNANGTNGSNTINVSALGAKNLMQYDVAGVKVPAVVVSGFRARAVYDGTDFVILNPLALERQITPVAASVGSNALTVSLYSCELDFRSSTLTVGTTNRRTVSPGISLVVPSGATLGTANGQAARLVLLALDVSGTVELAIVNLAGGNQLDETNRISTTAISAAADSANVIYSATGRTNVPYRVVGFLDITEATAGTWASAPSLVQGCGGQACVALATLGFGQTLQNLTASRALGTTYYNLTGKPIWVWCVANTGSASSCNLTVSGVTMTGSSYSTSGGSNVSSAIIPPGASYSYACGGTGATLNGWYELR